MKTLDVVIEQLCVNPHPPGFDAIRHGVQLRIADMSRERQLQFLESRQIETGFRHAVQRVLQAPLLAGMNGCALLRPTVLASAEN